MKKITLITFFAFLFIGFTTSVFAVSYGGSPAFSLPWVNTQSGVAYSVCSNGSCYDKFTFYKQFDATTLLWTKTDGARVTSTSISATGIVLISGGMPYNPWYCNQNVVYHTYLKQIPTGSWMADYYYEVATWWGWDPCTPITVLHSQKVLSLNLNDGSCSGMTNDCIIVAQPHFISTSNSAWLGIYLQYVDIIKYSDPWNVANFHRFYYGGITGQSSTLWQSSLSILQWDLFNYSNYGMRILNNYYVPGWYVYTMGTPANAFWYYTLDTEYQNDDTVMIDFLAWNWGSTGSHLSTYMTTWLGTSSLVSGTTGTGYTGTWNGNYPSGNANIDSYFVNCGSALDVWCYVKGFFTGFYNSIVSWFTDIFVKFFAMIFPDINFNGMSSTCINSSPWVPIVSTPTIDLNSQSSINVSVDDIVTFTCGNNSHTVDIFDSNHYLIGGFLCNTPVNISQKFSVWSYYLQENDGMSAFNFSDLFYSSAFAFSQIPFTVTDTVLSSWSTSAIWALTSNSLSTGSLTSLPFFQKISNLFVILVPVAPPNNSDVCTFEWIKRITYRQNTASVLDILFVMFAFVPLLFALKPHHD